MGIPQKLSPKRFLIIVKVIENNRKLQEETYSHFLTIPFRAAADVHSLWCSETCSGNSFGAFELNITKEKVYLD